MGRDGIRSQSGEETMADNLIGEIRRSAVIMTYAPGSVMDMRAEGAPVSGVSAGLEEWDRNASLDSQDFRNQKIIERRLCKKLGKRYFRLPPVLVEKFRKKDDNRYQPALVARRFPEWLQCPVCDRIGPARLWDQDAGRAYRYCASCSAGQPGNRKVYVVPVRFVIACKSGHLDEFPWHWWLRHRETCGNRSFLELRSLGPGLAGLDLRCPECGASRSLDGIFRKDALAGLDCRGRRPWLRSDDSNCNCSGKDGSLRVVQRGASNLYYPVLESALDIPPWSRNLERILADYWEDLHGIPDPEDRKKWIRKTPGLIRICERENIDAEELSRRFARMLDALDNQDTEKLREDEYLVFSEGKSENSGEFEMHPEVVPPRILPYVPGVVRVARLREVRALRGFTRIHPPSDSDSAEMAPISESDLDWLPAIEVRGEGIFISLDRIRLLEWENRKEIQDRCKPVDDAWSAEWSLRYPDKPKPYSATPRFLLVHTLAHALIRQLNLECGYSSASLRERLYVSEGINGMAGILVYTATSDSDGTLGGLQRRAMGDLFEGTFVGALRSSLWCSSDPLCINGELAAPDSHSLASCHCCTMVPETSCEFYNRFLDRALLVGTDRSPDIGYFRNLIFPA